MKILTVLFTSICFIVIVFSNVAYANCSNGDIECKVEELNNLSSKYLSAYEKLLKSDLSKKDNILELAFDFDQIVTGSIKSTFPPAPPARNTSSSYEKDSIEKNTSIKSKQNTDFYFMYPGQISKVHLIPLGENSNAHSKFEALIDNSTDFISYTYHKAGKLDDILRNKTSSDLILIYLNFYSSYDSIEEDLLEIDEFINKLGRLSNTSIILIQDAIMETSKTKTTENIIKNNISIISLKRNAYNKYINLYSFFDEKLNDPANIGKSLYTILMEEKSEIKIKGNTNVLSSIILLMN